MAEKPFENPLPADLPENWTAGQIVAPTGEEVGLSHQHGYNYLMEMVNRAQTALNGVNGSLSDILGRDILTDLSSTSPAKLDGEDNIRPGVTGILPISNGGTGVDNMAALRAMFGSGELGKYILTGTYSGHFSGSTPRRIYLKPDTEIGAQAISDSMEGKYGNIVLCSITFESTESTAGVNASVTLGGGPNGQNYWSRFSSTLKTVDIQIPLISCKNRSNDAGGRADYAYRTLTDHDEEEIRGNWLELGSFRPDGDEYDYRIDMLFLMPVSEHMGSNGGGEQGAPGHGIPAGGAAGQILSKKTAADYDTQWVNPPEGGSGGVAGVSSFKGRTGAVQPASGDYTAEMVGARPDDWMPSAADVGAVPAATISGFHVLTQAEYDALSTKDEKVLYLIKE